jgi:hypothetical protein
MQDNFSLLKLKLDMVYRDLSMEVAQQKFTESPPKVEVPEAVAEAPPAAPAKVKAKRKKLVPPK